ncbi:MAG: hypothetical protein Q8L88_12335 [Bacteroidota bacterium]|nr:hypothetical protein [Bacteroidota bacterium]
MTAPFFTPLTPIYSTKNIDLLDDEKEQIIEKVYNNDVFKDFIRQWGDAMPSLDNITRQNSVK